MKRFTLLTLLFVVVSLVFVTCKHEPEVIITGNGTDTSSNVKPIPEVMPPNLPIRDSICFTTQILPLFLSNCAQAPGCHSTINPKEGIILTNFDQIKLRLTKSMSEINKNAMPYKFYPKLDAAARALLNKWIAEGARNTDCYNSKSDTINVTYTTHIAPMMVNYCKGCHNTAFTAGGNQNGNVYLETYTDVKAKSQSGLMRCVVTGKGCKFMPQGGTHIGTMNVKKIDKWVEAGCPQ